MHYKDVFQHYYDEAIDELGYDDNAAGKYADAMMRDHYRAIADVLRDAQKEQGT